MNIVIDHLVAKKGSGCGRPVEKIGCLGQAGGHAGQVRGGVGIADKLFRRFDLVVDAVQAGGYGGCKGQIGVGIGAGQAIFRAEGLLVSDDAKTGGAVVTAPGDAGRGKRLGTVAFVRVDGGRVKQKELAAQRQQTA